MNYEIQVTVRRVDAGQVLEEHVATTAAATDGQLEGSGRRALQQAIGGLHAAQRERAAAANRLRSEAMRDGIGR